MKMNTIILGVGLSFFTFFCNSSSLGHGGGTSPKTLQLAIRSLIQRRVFKKLKLLLKFALKNS